MDAAGPGAVDAHAPPVARSTVDVFVKDSAIAIRLAEASGATVPLLRAAAEQFRWAHDAGLGAHDDSQVIDAYRGHCTPPSPSSPNEGSS